MSQSRRLEVSLCHQIVGPERERESERERERGGTREERERKVNKQAVTHTLWQNQGSAQNGCSGGPNKPRIGRQLPESAYITCKSGGYLPVSSGQLALVMTRTTIIITTVGRTLQHNHLNHMQQQKKIVQVIKDKALWTQFSGVQLNIVCLAFASRIPTSTMTNFKKRE